MQCGEFHRAVSCRLVFFAFGPTKTLVRSVDLLQRAESAAVCSKNTCDGAFEDIKKNQKEGARDALTHAWLR